MHPEPDVPPLPLSRGTRLRRAAHSRLHPVRRRRLRSAFPRLTPAALATASLDCRVRRVTAGDVVVTQGAAADAMWVVLRGTLDAIHTHKGCASRVGTLRPGDAFGEIALLRRSVRTAAVVAVTPCTLLVLTERTFTEMGAASLATVADLTRLARRRLDEHHPAPG